MKEILAVFRFTFKDNIRKRAFILTTLLVLALIVVACARSIATTGIFPISTFWFSIVMSGSSTRVAPVMSSLSAVTSTSKEMVCGISPKVSPKSEGVTSSERPSMSTGWSILM